MHRFWPRQILFFLFASALFAVAFSSGFAQADDEDLVKPEGAELHASLDEVHHVLIVPNIAPTVFGLDYSGLVANPGHDSATGVQFGVRVLSSSNRTRSILVGLDLREVLAQTAGTSGIDLLGTKLGARIEWRPDVALRPGIGIAFFFGDTIVDQHRGMQFNGNTGALFAGVNVGATRLFAEATIGTYYEGPGFILLARTAGNQSLNFRALALGVEFPIDVLWPSWLSMKPQQPDPAPP